MTLPARALKPKKCRSCREAFVPRNSLQVACGPICALSLVQKQNARTQQKRQREERKELKAAKEKFKTRRDHLKEAQVAFNAFIRLRDQLAGHACISSGQPLDWSGNSTDAGHYRSVGAAPHLRFNELNCHAQRKHDNQWKSGAIQDYRIGLIARIGLEAVEALEADNTIRRYTIEELQAIKATYRAKVRELKRGME